MVVLSQGSLEHFRHVHLVLHNLDTGALVDNAAQVNYCLLVGVLLLIYYYWEHVAGEVPSHSCRGFRAAISPAPESDHVCSRGGR